MNSHLRPVLLLPMKMTEPCHSLGFSLAVAQSERNCAVSVAVRRDTSSARQTGASERHSGRRGLFITEACVFCSPGTHPPVQKNLNDNSLSVRANQSAAPMTPAVSTTLSH